VKNICKVLDTTKLLCYISKVPDTNHNQREEFHMKKPKKEKRGIYKRQWKKISLLFAIRITATPFQGGM